MNWKFWKKGTQSQPLQDADQVQWPNSVDESASFLAGMFVERLLPFSDWKSPTASVPPELEELFATSVWGFQLSLWFVILTSQRGQQTCEFAMDQFYGMLGAINPDLEVETRKLLEFSMEGMNAYSGEEKLLVEGRELEMPLAYFLAVHSLSRNVFSPFYNTEPHQRQSATLQLAKCMDHANEAALSIFVPMHQSISSNPLDREPLDHKGR